MATINAIGSDKPIQVTFGGSGVATLTDHGVMVGSGTSPIDTLALGTNGQALLGSTGVDPVFATLASTNGSITYTTGAGSLNPSLPNYIASTFVPVLAFGGASVGITYSIQTAMYVRVYNLVYLTLAIVLTSKGTSVGSMTISGLPVAPNATPSQLNVQGKNLTYAGELICSTSSAGVLQVQRIASAAGVNTLVNTEFADTSELYITGIYFT